MKAIISVATDPTSYPEVGMTDRTIVSRYKTIEGVERYARSFAGMIARGKGNSHGPIMGTAYYRIEIFSDSGIYNDPYLVLHKSLKS